MHPKNKHQSDYDLAYLCTIYKSLKPFVITNQYGKETLNFALPESVKALNTALLKAYYNIDYWGFPDTNLCPPIPGRVDYLHYLNDLLESSYLNTEITILDIGTGATCIYPLLGNAEYNWRFIATDIDEKSIDNAQRIVEKNELTNFIKLRRQRDSSKILKGILNTSDKITACMCNPPFYKSESDAISATTKKLKGLKDKQDKVVRNFSGTQNELWYKGGEKAFIHNYLYESSLFKTNCFWYTTLVSNKDNVRPMKVSLKKLGATKIQVINMSQGNKVSRIVAWTFLSETEQKQWH